MPLLLDIYRYLHALGMAAFRTFMGLTNRAHALGSLAAIAFPVAAAYAAVEFRAFIEQRTGLREDWALWATLGLSSILVAGFLAWREKAQRVHELETALIPTIAYWFVYPEISGMKELRLILENTSDRQIDNCEVRLRSVTNHANGRVSPIGDAFRQLADGEVKFSIPPRGHSSLTIVSRDSMSTLRILGGVPAMGAVVNQIGPIKGPHKLDIVVQATNLKRQDIVFEYTDEVVQ